MTAYALDHVAIAVRTWGTEGAVFPEKFGAQRQHGNLTGPMAPCQVKFRNDMRVELLAPGTDPGNFVQKYLDNVGGCAPHHMTFKVDDLDETLAAIEAAGGEPILVNRSFPSWQEAFLHPKATGLGILVQVAQQSEPEDGWGPGETSPWPPAAAPAWSFEEVFLEVADFERTDTVYVHMLGATARELPNDGGFARRGYRWGKGAEIVARVNEREPATRGVTAFGLVAPEGVDVNALGEPTSEGHDYQRILAWPDLRLDFFLK